MESIDRQTLAGKVLDKISDIVVVTDTEGEVLFMNASAKKFLRSNQPVFKIEHCFLHAINPHWKTLIQNSLNATIGHQTASTFELDYRVDGKVYFFDISCSPFTISNNEVRHVLIQIRDITVQKVYENKITSTAKDLKDLVERANALIIGIDTSGNIIEWNDFASALTDFSPVLD